jgi:hypothetical protein
MWQWTWFSLIGPDERKAWSEWLRGQGLVIFILLIILFGAVPSHINMITTHCDERLDKLLEHNTMQQEFDRELYRQSIEALCRAIGNEAFFPLASDEQSSPSTGVSQ